MGKKVKEYKSGDFIFAKVKGYPAWPARVQKPNGKKYFVYFYGTGETANLPPNMIFDYAENKDKFLTKTVKRRDFNDGVKQIEYDFANNVPLEEVIGVPIEVQADMSASDTANDSAMDTTMDESVADTTANDTAADDVNTTQTDAAVEDSDEAGALVIDEGKTPVKGKKAKSDAKAKETPKPAKTPRGKAKKDEPKEKDKEDEKIDEELVSRSGRKIRPKRYIDEQTEDNATLPSPATKRRRTSPVGEKEKPEAPKEKEGKSEKTFTEYNVVKQSELEVLKKPFEPAAEDDKDKENILIAYLPNGAYAGIRVFQSRPKAFKNEAARIQWDKQAARNALTLKMQLEREHITPQSVAGQLVMELNLTDEEKATLDKERETEEKKSRVNFLKTEMKLIDLDAKIKTCLCLEKADTELCLKLLDELLGLEVKPLMLLKHPTCLETVKRMRAYVGNTPSWDLSEQDALHFSKQAHTIRKKADALYKNMKEHFHTPEGLSFWEYFSERVLTFKKVTATLNAGELLELVHEPIELSQPHTHSMRAAIEEANHSVPPLPDTPEKEEDKQIKKKTPVKSKKPTPAPTPSKSRRTRNKKEDDSTLEPDAQKTDNTEDTQKEGNGTEAKKTQDGDSEEASNEPPKEPESTLTEPNEDVEMAEIEKAPGSEVTNESTEKETQKSPEASETSEESKQSKAEKAKEPGKAPEKSSKKDKKSRDEKIESEKSVKDNESAKDAEKKEKRNSKDEKNSNNAKGDKNDKESEKSGKESGKEKEDKPETDKSDDKDKDESRAKRSRESKKTDPPPRSPAKRKSKF